jgi:hypothetical protein
MVFAASPAAAGPWWGLLFVVGAMKVPWIAALTLLMLVQKSRQQKVYGGTERDGRIRHVFGAPNAAGDRIQINLFECGEKILV